jgi:hypothetical protein
VKDSRVSVISLPGPFSGLSPGFAPRFAASDSGEAAFDGAFGFEAGPLFAVAAALVDFALAGAAFPLCAGAVAAFVNAGLSAVDALAPTICSLLVCSLVAATALDAARFACVNVDIDCALSRGAKAAARQTATIPAAIDFVFMINFLPSPGHLPLDRHSRPS